MLGVGGGCGQRVEYDQHFISFTEKAGSTLDVCRDKRF